MKLTELLKQGSLDTKKTQEIIVPKKYRFKTSLFSLLFIVVLLIPFLLIYINVFKMVSLVRMAFIINLIIAVQIFLIILTLGSLFEIMLLREYIKNDNEAINAFETEIVEINKKTKEGHDLLIKDTASEMIDKINELNLKAILIRSRIKLSNLIIIILMLIIYFLCRIVLL